MSLKIIYNDICRERTDVLVTAASRFPRVGTGLDRAVHAAAGPQLLDERKKLGNIGPGVVGVSPAFELKAKIGAKYVIHALGPIWNTRAGIREELILSGCYFRILLKAVELKCKTVSLPVLSSGKFGMPMATALKVAVDSIETFLRAVPTLTVKLVGIDPEFLSCVRGLYARYLVNSLTEAQAAALRESAGSLQGGYVEFLPGKEEPYFDQCQFERDTNGATFKKLFMTLWNRKIASEKEKRNQLKGQRVKGVQTRRLLVTNRALADATGISERSIRNFCAVGSGSDRTSKDKIFALSVALELSVRYTEALLATCGYKFEDTSRDELIYGLIENACPSTMEMNMKLQEQHLPILNLCDEKRCRSRASSLSHSRSRVLSACGTSRPPTRRRS